MANSLVQEVSDNFNRANSTNLGANWNEISGDASISSNQLICTVAGCDLIYTGAAISAADSYAKFTWTAGFGVTRPTIYLRATSNSSDGYLAAFNIGGYVQYWRKVGGGYTSLGTGGTHTYVAGDECLFIIRTEGGNPVLRSYVDGQLMWTYTDTDVAKITATGYSGIRFSTTGPTLDDFEGGTLGAYPVESAGGRSNEFSDDFIRADSTSLGASWNENVGNTQILGYLANGINNNGAGGNEITHTTIMSDAECYAKAIWWGQYNLSPQTERISLHLRATTTGFTAGYSCSFRNADSIVFYKKAASVYTPLLVTVTIRNYSIEDSVLFECTTVGGNAVLTAYVNGSQVEQYTDTSSPYLSAGYSGARFSNPDEWIAFFDAGTLPAAVTGPTASRRFVIMN